jgi:hypothetical protein
MSWSYSEAGGLLHYNQHKVSLLQQLTHAGVAHSQQMSSVRRNFVKLILLQWKQHN